MYDSPQTRKYKKLQRALERELRVNLENAKNEDAKAQVELQRFFNKQVDKKYLTNQRKRITLAHQVNKRFYDIKNALRKKTTEITETSSGNKSRITGLSGVFSSLPNLKKVPEKYKDLVNVMNGDDGTPEVKKLPTIYLDKSTFKEIDNSLKATLKRYKFICKPSKISSMRNSSKDLSKLDMHTNSTLSVEEAYFTGTQDYRKENMKELLPMRVLNKDKIKKRIQILKTKSPDHGLNFPKIRSFVNKH